MAKKREPQITLVIPLRCASAALFALKGKMDETRQQVKENPGDEFWTDALAKDERDYTDFDRAYDAGKLTY